MKKFLVKIKNKETNEQERLIVYGDTIDEALKKTREHTYKDVISISSDVDTAIKKIKKHNAQILNKAHEGDQIEFDQCIMSDTYNNQWYTIENNGTPQKISEDMYIYAGYQNGCNWIYYTGTRGCRPHFNNADVWFNI